MKYPYRLILRITLALIIALNYNLFLKILTPLTIYPSYLFIKLIDSPTLTNNTIIISTHSLIFTPACIASSAYLLITLLTLLTRKINFKKTIKVLLTGYALILAGNLLRIFILAIILIKIDQNLFHIIHLTFWEFISTIYVALTWIILTKIYKIKTIPVYSDISFLVNNLR